MSNITDITIAVVIAEIITHFLIIAGNSVYDQYLRISEEVDKEEPDGYN